MLNSFRNPNCLTENSGSKIGKNGKSRLEISKFECRPYSWHLFLIYSFKNDDMKPSKRQVALLLLPFLLQFNGNVMKFKPESQLFEWKVCITKVNKTLDYYS